VVPDDGGQVGVDVHQRRLDDAYRRAAGRWRWRVAVAPQDRLADIHQLIEAAATTSAPVTSTTRSLPATRSPTSDRAGIAR